MSSGLESAESHNLADGRRLDSPSPLRRLSSMPNLTGSGWGFSWPWHTVDPLPVILQYVILLPSLRNMIAESITRSPWELTIVTA